MCEEILIELKSLNKRKLFYYYYYYFTLKHKYFPDET